MSESEHREMEEFDLFDSIVRNTASDEVQKAFAERSATDAKFAQRFAVFQRTIEHIALNAKEKSSVDSSEMRARLKAEDKKLDKRGIRQVIPWSATAAVLLLLIGVWFFGDRDLNQELAAEFAYPEMGLPVTMGNSGSMDAIMNAYKTNDFPSAIGLIEKDLIDNPKNDTLLYFHGVVDLKMGDPKQAGKHFQMVARSSVFKERAQYQSALSALLLDEKDRAVAILKELQEANDAQVADRARRLLDRLK